MLVGERMKLLMEPTGEGVLAEETKDLHTRRGVVKAAAIEAAQIGELLASNTGFEFRVLDAGFRDRYQRLRRGPQVMLPKDAAAIIAMTGIGKESVVVDAGAGTGAMACLLGHVAKQVFSYDVRKDFAELAASNAALLGLKNVTVKNKSVAEVDERNVDAVCLDLPDPWNYVVAARTALRPGGYLSSYSPHAHQMQQLVAGLAPHFLHVRSFEVIERDWVVDEKRLRPQNTGLLHTGFITIARRMF